MRYCDGMIFGLSKCFTTAAFLGRPMLRLSKFETGDWLGAHTELPAFVDALRAGTARAPSKADALRWFAFHHANTIIDPANLDLDLAQLMDHAMNPVNPVNPARWDRAWRAIWAVARQRCRRCRWTQSCVPCVWPEG